MGLSLYVAGLGTGPMILSPLSEVCLPEAALAAESLRIWMPVSANRPQFFGRRPVYICSFTFFLIFMIPCAVARNVQTMLVARFLDGLAGSAFLSVAGGTVGDMYARHVSHCGHD